MAFQSDATSGVLLWTGNPDCQAGHDWLLNWLQMNAVPFLPAPPAWLNTRRQGNLAEAVSMCLGWNLPRLGTRCYPANGQSPLSDISRPDIDLFWLGFGSLPGDDFIVIQEIKCTGGTDLSYADSLLKDYAKLFAPNPDFTLQTRIQAIQTLMLLQDTPETLIRRVSRIAGTSPHTSGMGVRLVPTLVHDLNSVPPTPKMLAVTATLTTRGWANVEPWAIGMTDLLDRFGRLSRGMH